MMILIPIGIKVADKKENFPLEIIEDILSVSLIVQTEKGEAILIPH